VEVGFVLLISRPVNACIRILNVPFRNAPFHLTTRASGQDRSNNQDWDDSSDKSPQKNTAFFHFSSMANLFIKLLLSFY
jgi:hypothetical protein